MAEHSLVYTLATPGGTVQTNTGSAHLRLGGVQGLDGAPIRAPIDNRPQTHGGLVHRFLLGPRHMTFNGQVYVSGAASEAAYLSARNGVIDAWETALLSILGSDGTLSWTPSGGSLKHLYVRHDQPLETTGSWLKELVFGLVAASPTPF